MKSCCRAPRRRFLAALGGLAFAAAAPPSIAANGLQAAEPLPPPPPRLRDALAAVSGRPVLVNFWASWCAPCREELPGMVDLVERHPEIALITVAVADRAADTQRFLAQTLLDGIVVVADHDQQIARAWRAGMVPTTYLLDARHQARARMVGEADWRDPALRSRIEDILIINAKDTSQ